MTEQEKEQLIALLEWLIVETRDIAFVIDNEVHEHQGHCLLMSSADRVLH